MRDFEGPPSGSTSGECRRVFAVPSCRRASEEIFEVRLIDDRADGEELECVESIAVAQVPLDVVLRAT